MSTRTNLRPQIVIPNEKASPANTGSMTTSITSAPILMQSLIGMGFSYSWTGTTPIGTLSVEVSNDYKLDFEGNVLAAGTWTTLILNLNGVPVSSIPVTGNTGNAFIDVRETQAYAIRTVYTRTSGIGTLQAIANGKVS